MLVNYLDDILFSKNNYDMFVEFWKWMFNYYYDFFFASMLNSFVCIVIFNQIIILF